MDNAAPPAYTYYRVGWSAAHIALVGMLFLSIVTWFVHDGQGQRAVLNIWAGLGKIQQRIANILPFPWEKNTSKPIAKRLPRVTPVSVPQRSSTTRTPVIRVTTTMDPNNVLLVHDTFDGASIADLNSSWGAFGARVLLGAPAGWLSIRADVVDTYPRIATLDFAPSEMVSILLRHRMIPSPSQPNHFFPSVSFTFASGKSVSLTWLRSSYAPDYCNAPNGFDRVTVKRSDGSCVMSTIQSSALYNAAVVSKIFVDAKRGTFAYDLGANGTVDFSGTLGGSSEDLVSGFEIHGYGWNTGHRHELDEIYVWGQGFGPGLPDLKRAALRSAPVHSGPGTEFSRAGFDLAQGEVTSVETVKDGWCMINSSEYLWVHCLALDPPFGGWKDVPGSLPARGH